MRNFLHKMFTSLLGIIFWLEHGFFEKVYLKICIELDNKKSIKRSNVLQMLNVT